MTEQLARIMEKAMMTPNVSFEFKSENKLIYFYFIDGKTKLPYVTEQISYDETYNFIMGYDIQKDLDAIERALDQLQEGVA